MSTTPINEARDLERVPATLREWAGRQLASGSIVDLVESRAYGSADVVATAINVETREAVRCVGAGPMVPGRARQVRGAYVFSGPDGIETDSAGLRK